MNEEAKDARTFRGIVTSYDRPNRRCWVVRSDWGIDFMVLQSDLIDVTSLSSGDIVTFDAGDPVRGKQRTAHAVNVRLVQRPARRA